MVVVRSVLSSKLRMVRSTRSLYALCFDQVTEYPKSMLVLGFVDVKINIIKQTLRVARRTCQLFSFNCRVFEDGVGGSNVMAVGCCLFLYIPSYREKKISD